MRIKPDTLGLLHLDRSDAVIWHMGVWATIPFVIRQARYVERSIKWPVLSPLAVGLGVHVKPQPRGHLVRRHAVIAIERSGNVVIRSRLVGLLPTFIVPVLIQLHSCRWFGFAAMFLRITPVGRNTKLNIKALKSRIVPRDLVQDVRRTGFCGTDYRTHAARVIH